MKDARKITLVIRTAVMITFRKSNKNHQCYSRSWKRCPPGRMHSEQQEKAFFTLCSSFPKISVLSETNGLQMAFWYPFPYFLTSCSCLQSCKYVCDFKQVPRLAPSDRISPYTTTTNYHKNRSRTLMITRDCHVLRPKHVTGNEKMFYIILRKGISVVF